MSLLSRHSRFWLLLTASMALGLPGQAASQLATGRITDESTGEAVAGAMVTMLDASRDVVRRVVSGPAGQYTIQAPEPGEFWLTADFLGYQRLESPLLALGEASTVTVDFELPVDPIELEGLEVAAERDEELRQRVRMWGVRPDDLGPRWVDRKQIERWQAAEDFGVALRAQAIAGVEVIRSIVGNGMPGVCVSIRNGGCALVVWTGQPGSQVTAGLIPPMSLGAVVLLRPQEATLIYGTDGGNGAVLLFSLAGM
ncbi:MAG: carboxypeptidase-like regulatory domain-containing protein [Longimicrobiales bacterium]|nr:carboxypeptidase-like regulatory domain-containing protein [Longimicrobiales bacterium]